MDFALKDEPLDLDFNLQEPFKILDPKNKFLIDELAALFKEGQIFLQESENEMKNMQNSFEKIKKRHTENLAFTFQVMQLLNSYIASPLTLLPDESPENIENVKLSNAALDHAYNKPQTDNVEVTEHLQSDTSLKDLSKEDANEMPDNFQSESESKSLSNKNRVAKPSLTDETRNLQLEDADSSEMLYVDITSVDVRKGDSKNKNKEASSFESNLGISLSSVNKNTSENLLEFFYNFSQTYDFFPARKSQEFSSIAATSHSSVNKNTSEKNDSGGSGTHTKNSDCLPATKPQEFSTIEGILNTKRKVKRKSPCKDCPSCIKKIKVYSNGGKVSHDLTSPDVSQSSKNIKIISHTRLCPLKECRKSEICYKRLDNHLRKKHNLSSDSEVFQALCPVREDSLQQSLKKVKKVSPFSKISRVNVKSQNKLDNILKDSQELLTKILPVSSKNIPSAPNTESGNNLDNILKETQKILTDVSPVSSKSIPSTPNTESGNNLDNILKERQKILTDSPVSSENIPSTANIKSSYPERESKSLPTKLPLRHQYSFKSRRTFNSDERVIIIETFKEFIDKEFLPSIPTIRQYMNKEGPLKSMVKEKNYQPSQIKGCLLGIINIRKRDALFLRYALRQCRKDSEEFSFW